MVVTASVIGASAMAAPLAVALKISEFRVRGPNGANDEFVELYNEANSPLTVTSAAPSVGWSVVASNGVARFTVPNGTVIPAHGHYLGVNAVGYSLASYPAGTGTTATGDATYTTDIPDNAGIAVFDTSVAADFTLAHRLDAVGSSSEANTLYKEGTGYQALTPFSINYAFPRDLRGGTPKDTASNSADLLFVDTNGTSAGAGQRLGAPGPENLSSPVNLDSGGIGTSLVDPAAGSNAPPNQVRDFTSDPANNSTFGTLDIRRKFTNNTGQAVRRLRIRITDLTTFPSPSTIADLRPRTSTAVVVSLTGGGTTTVQGTTLEQPPAQPNGGGFNSTLSAGTVTLATPLADGASINLRFLMGIQQTGTFRLCGLVEGLPSPATRSRRPGARRTRRQAPPARPSRTWSRPTSMRRRSARRLRRIPATRSPCPPTATGPGARPSSRISGCAAPHPAPARQTSRARPAPATR